MNPKSPPSHSSTEENKTILVKSRPIPADDSKTVLLDSGARPLADESVTRLINTDETLHPDPGQSELLRQGLSRPRPTPPLAWSARDQHPLAPIQKISVEEVVDSLVSRPNGLIASPDHKETGPFSGGEKKEASLSPVVGWLVVVEGPGKGRSREICVGANSIGCDDGEQICLKFGDPEIHRHKHAIVVFDPRSRRFFLQSGDFSNFTYLGEELVLSTVELKGGETIIMGQTHMRFVPFCGSNFSWS
jgi:hypothetical protein